MNREDYINILKKRLSPKRLAHSIAVMETAEKMGENSAVDPSNLWLASLLHDYAKELSSTELLTIARENGLLTSEVEEWHPRLLHGVVGSFLCARELQIKNKEVLQAITYHTTGHGAMSLLDKLVFLADLLEPGRCYPGLDKLRGVCAEDLDRGLLLAFDSIIQCLLQRKLLIHPLTIQARNSFLQQEKRRDIRI